MVLLILNKFKFKLYFLSIYDERKQQQARQNWGNKWRWFNDEKLDINQGSQKDSQLN